MAGLSIGEVARRANVRASAIRYYEDEGLIPPPARRRGRRVFDESVLDHLALIALAQAAGFSIAEIRQLKRGIEATGPGASWRELGAVKVVELDRRIRAAQRTRALLERVVSSECAALSDCARLARAGLGA